MISTHGFVAAVPPLGAADTGGQVVYVLELSKSLSRLGFDVDIWTRRFEDQEEIEEVSDHARIIRAECGGPSFIPKERLFPHMGEWARNALAFIKDNALSYSLIDSHYWDAGAAGTILHKALGAAHMHTPHSLGIWKKRQMEIDFPGDSRKLEEVYNFGTRIRTETEIYSAADVVVATTGQQHEMLVGEYGLPGEKCRVISAGYAEDRFHPVSEDRRREIRRRLGFTGPVVMAVGRLARNKGYDLLIDAFTHVAARMPGAVLALYAGGAERTPAEQDIYQGLLRRVEERGLKGRVRFGSFIPDTELADYYRAADVFALSSRYEPFGMTAIEAMACGTPIVVTVHGGLHQALEYGAHALYADPFDEEELGAALFMVLKHEGLHQRLSRLGAEAARNLFTWTGVARRVLSAAGLGSTGLETSGLEAAGQSG